MNSPNKSWWDRVWAPSQSLQEGETGATLQLPVLAAGLCCAVGYGLDAAEPATRANLDHFQQSTFQTLAGDAVKVARLPDTRVWGPKRMAMWLQMAVRDTLARLPAETQFASKDCALLILTAELARTDMSEASMSEVLSASLTALGQNFHPQSAVLGLGRAGLGTALRHAQHILRGSPDVKSEGSRINGPKHVMLVGVDSLLNSGVISHYLAQGRLLVPGNNDGFMPGEAAGAILLGRPEATSMNLGGPGQTRSPMTLLAVAEATEEARWDGTGPPNRSLALTTAVRTACEAANVSPLDLAFRASDYNGEAFYGREATNAFTRLRFGGQALPLMTTAASWGDVGAAWGPATLAYLFKRAQRGDDWKGWPGRLSLLHAANDTGLRSALVVAATSYQSEVSEVAKG
jgi:3-oxoacyl-[acyl-carrier-protein] synthase I